MSDYFNRSTATRLLAIGAMALVQFGEGDWMRFAATMVVLAIYSIHCGEAR